MRHDGSPYPKHSLHEYARTKALAEQMVLRANGLHGVYSAVIGHIISSKFFIF